jgi:hypothetical protein
MSAFFRTPSGSVLSSGEGRCADGGADLEIFVEDLEGFGADNAQDALGDVAGGVDVGRERHHDGEFIRVHTGDDGGFGHRGAQALADALQNRVADIVAHGVVDVLEMVDVDRDDCKARHFLVIVMLGFVREVLQEQGAVGKRCQRVVVSEFVNLAPGFVFEVAEVGGVLVDQILGDLDGTADFIVGVEWRGLDLRVFGIFCWPREDCRA